MQFTWGPCSDAGANPPHAHVIHPAFNIGLTVNLAEVDATVVKCAGLDGNNIRHSLGFAVDA
jgi:hypothetical protein